MNFLLSIIIPVIVIVACIVFFLYSLIHHTWETTGKIAIVIAIALAVGALSQGLGSKLDSDKGAQDRKEENEEIRINQDRNYDKLLEIEAKIDNNMTFDDTAEPSDEITDWVVKNRTDVIYKKDIFFVDMKVRKAGTKEWQWAIEADIGDTIEFQAEYCNRGSETVKDIMARSILPTNMEYVENSTVLYNAIHKGGIAFSENTITTSGINIGDYNSHSNAYVRFKTKIIDVNLAEGNNQLVTWASITQNDEALYYDASVFVEK